MNPTALGRVSETLIAVADFDAVWERIKRHAGEQFETIRGLPFTYEVPGNYLRVTRDDEVNRPLSRTNFAKAFEHMPVNGQPWRASGSPRLVVHVGDTVRPPYPSG